ncbi:MAG: CopG family ribbon-helix-helix protein [Neisseriaceae bacterium]
MATETLALRVPSELKEKIEKLATVTHRKKSDIVLAWLKEKIDIESWQIEETIKAIELADSGGIATPEDVLKVHAKWKI